MILLTHGGGANQPDELNTRKTKSAQVCIDNVDTTMSALDMVEQAVRELELEPIFNAGYGSVVQMDGVIRMDAGICTSKGQYGAVMQIQNVHNPIQVARAVMDRGYHSILSGDGATAFAREIGIPSLSPYTADRLLEINDIRTNDIRALTYDALANDIESTNVKKLSTVDAVAIDNNGILAAACSTGGTKYCYPGRVGDTPIYGAGVYCSEYVAVACTGEGDKVLRRLTSKKVEEFYLQTGNLKTACDMAVQDLWDKEKGYVGIIAISSKGDHATANNTYFMASALKQSC